MTTEEESLSVALPNQIALSPEVLFQELDGQSVLLNLQDEHYYGLDDVGSRAWQLLAEGREMDSVVQDLLAEYDVDEADLRRDLADLIGKLAEAGLVAVQD